MARVYAISEPEEAGDSGYADSLRPTVAAAVDYGIAVLEHSGDHPPPIPTALLSQARLAARSRVSLDTVLRRYLAGYTLLGDFVIEESERSGISTGPALRSLLRLQASLFDRLLSAVTAEYNRESSQAASPQRRRADRVCRLLAGELLHAPELAYDFDVNHLGLVTEGEGANEILRPLAQGLGARLLLVPHGESVSWAWLGSRKPLDPERVQKELRSLAPRETWVAIGESGTGLSGWRITHRQAAAALPLAREDNLGVIRYADVALLASMMRDDLLVNSLQNLYLEPLSKDSERGKVLCETLRAYLAHDRNISSTASALEVSRQTVNRRLQSIEQHLGASLRLRALDIEAALRLDGLQNRPPADPRWHTSAHTAHVRSGDSHFRLSQVAPN